MGDWGKGQGVAQEHKQDGIGGEDREWWDIKNRRMNKMNKK